MLVVVVVLESRIRFRYYTTTYHPIQILYDDVPFIFLLADAQKLQSALAGEQRLLRDSKHGNHC